MYRRGWLDGGGSIAAEWAYPNMLSDADVDQPVTFDVSLITPTEPAIGVGNIFNDMAGNDFIVQSLDGASSTARYRAVSTHDGNAVHYDNTDGKTAQEQAQARANMDAASASELQSEIGRAQQAEGTLQDNIDGVASDLSTHESNTDNPHSVSKAQVGLSNVDDTSDVDKPVSDAVRDLIGDLSLVVSETGSIDFGSSVQSICSKLYDLLHAFWAYDMDKVYIGLPADPMAYWIAGTGTAPTAQQTFSSEHGSTVIATTGIVTVTRYAATDTEDATPITHTLTDSSGAWIWPAAYYPVFATTIDGTAVKSMGSITAVPAVFSAKSVIGFARFADVSALVTEIGGWAELNHNIGYVGDVKNVMSILNWIYQFIVEQSQLKTPLGSIATYAAIPTTYEAALTTFGVSSIQVSDYFLVTADEQHGGSTAQYVVQSVDTDHPSAAGSFAAVYQFTYNTDVTSFLQKLTETSGNYIYTHENGAETSRQIGNSNDTDIPTWKMLSDAIASAVADYVPLVHTSGNYKGTYGNNDAAITQKEENTSTGEQTLVTQGALVYEVKATDANGKNGKLHVTSSDATLEFDDTRTPQNTSVMTKSDADSAYVPKQVANGSNQTTIATSSNIFNATTQSSSGGSSVITQPTAATLQSVSSSGGGVLSLTTGDAQLSFNGTRNTLTDNSLMRKSETDAEYVPMSVDGASGASSRISNTGTQVRQSATSAAGRTTQFRVIDGDVQVVVNGGSLDAPTDDSFMTKERSDALYSTRVMDSATGITALQTYIDAMSNSQVATIILGSTFTAVGTAPSLCRIGKASSGTTIELDCFNWSGSGIWHRTTGSTTVATDDPFEKVSTSVTGSPFVRGGGLGGFENGVGRITGITALQGMINEVLANNQAFGTLITCQYSNANGTGLTDDKFTNITDTAWLQCIIQTVQASSGTRALIQLVNPTAAIYYVRTQNSNTLAAADTWATQNFNNNVSDIYSGNVQGLTALKAYIATMPNMSTATVFYYNANGSGLTNDIFTAIPNLEMINLTINRHGGATDISMYGFTWNTGKIWSRITANAPAADDVWVSRFVTDKYANSFANAANNGGVQGITALNAYITAMPVYSTASMYFANNDAAGLTNDHFTSLPYSGYDLYITKYSQGYQDIWAFAYGTNGSTISHRTTSHAQAPASTDTWDSIDAARMNTNNYTTIAQFQAAINSQQNCTVRHYWISNGIFTNLSTSPAGWAKVVKYANGTGCSISLRFTDGTTAERIPTAITIAASDAFTSAKAATCTNATGVTGTITVTKKEGIVYLTGDGITSTNAIYGTTLFMVPAGYRPATRTTFQLYVTAGTGDTNGLLSTTGNTAGTISAGGTFSLGGSWISA
jgi:hypothetical protein